MIIFNIVDLFHKYVIATEVTKIILILKFNAIKEKRMKTIVNRFIGGINIEVAYSMR